MKIRSGYIWMALALALFCYIYFYDSKRTSTGDERKNAGRIFDFDWDKISQLDLISPAETIVIQRRGELWRIIKPVEGLADTEAVTKILQDLSFAHSKRIISYKQIPDPKDQTIQQWNLHPAENRILLRSSNKVYELLVGRLVPSETSAYARTSDQPGVPVVLVDANLKKSVDKNLSQLRSRQVFAFIPTMVRRVQLREYATSAAVVSHETEMAVNTPTMKWTMQKPLAARVNTQKMVKWLKDLEELKIIDFVSDESANFASYGLSTPEAQLSLATSDKPVDEETLFIGRPVPGKPNEIYAKLSAGSSIFTLPKDKVTQALSLLADTRDRFLLDVEPRLIASISVERAGKKISITRDLGNWRDDSDGSVMDSQKITQFIHQICVTPILSFVKDSVSDLKPYGLDKTTTRIVLKQPGMMPAQIQVLVGRQDKGQLYVKNTLEPSIYAVPANFVDMWPKSSADWRETKIFDFPMAGIVGIKIQTPQQTVSARRNANNVFEAEPGAKPVDALKLEEVLRALVQLKAGAFAGVPQPSYGLDKPAMRITILTCTKNQALVIGPATNDGSHWVQLDGSPSCFFITPEAFDALSQNVLLERPDSVPKP